jgi:hypothetical protein
MNTRVLIWISSWIISTLSFSLARGDNLKQALFRLVFSGVLMFGCYYVIYECFKYGNND